MISRRCKPNHPLVPSFSIIDHRFSLPAENEVRFGKPDHLDHYSIWHTGKKKGKMNSRRLMDMYASCCKRKTCSIRRFIVVFYIFPDMAVYFFCTRIQFNQAPHLSRGYLLLALSYNQIALHQSAQAWRWPFQRRLSRGVLHCELMWLDAGGTCKITYLHDIRTALSSFYGIFSEPHAAKKLFSQKTKKILLFSALPPTPVWSIFW